MASRSFVLTLKKNKGWISTQACVLKADEESQSEGSTSPGSLRASSEYSGSEECGGSENLLHKGRVSYSNLYSLALAYNPPMTTPQIQSLIIMLLENKK
jgi:hypothetical protein